MALQRGSLLGPYEIQATLGAGGMGTVYRAYDTTLQRPVAIKVLSEADEQARGKLLAEARAASALDHPNICTVYEVGEAVPQSGGGRGDPTSDAASRSAGDPASENAQPYIVMALVEGKPLSELIPSDGLPLESVIRYGLQIADALAHAHDKGIVHRDLKSQNVVITTDGRAKVLDFGLATQVARPDVEAVTVSLETQAAASQVAGTLAYMAPEVLRGEAATARSDIWALGVLLYEMVAGRLPFSGTTRTDIVSAIVKETPQSLSPKVPPSLRSVIQRCLAKEAGERYGGAAVVQGALEAIHSDTSVTPIPEQVAPRQRRSPRVVWAAAAVAVVTSIAGYALWPASTASSPPRFVNARQITSATGVESQPTWSPDGSTLAFASDQTGPWDLWVAQIGAGAPVNRTAHPENDTHPSWSPDGTQLAFWSARQGGGYFVMPSLGGLPQLVISAPVFQYSRPVWSADGTELAGVVQDDAGPHIEILTLRDRATREISLPLRPALSAADLSWSPDGRFFAYAEAIDNTSEVTQLWIVRLDDGQPFAVSDGRTNDWSPFWSVDASHLYFVSNRGGSMDLWRVDVAPDGTPGDEAEQLTTGVGMANVSFSHDQTKLAYVRGRLVGNLWRVPILDDRRATWADAEQLTFDQAYIQFADVSSDGRDIIFSSDRAGNQDLWMMPVAGGEPRRLTSDPTPDWAPQLSPDGQQVVFYSYRSGNRDIWVMPTAGGAARQLTARPEADLHPVWSPDGGRIAFVSGGTTSPEFEIWEIDADGGEPRQLTDHPASENTPQWSPDGSTFVFRSNRSGEVRLWIRSAGDDRVLTRPGSTPRWSADGANLYFISRDDEGDLAGVRQLWVHSMLDGSERPLTALENRRGNIGGFALDTDGEFLYFAWTEDVGDIWVMDVVQDEP